MIEKDIFATLKEISPFVRIADIRDQFIPSTDGWVNDDNIFTFIEKGQMEVILGGKAYTAREGDAIMMPPYLPHLTKVSLDESCTRYICHFDINSTKKREVKQLIPVVEGEYRTLSPSENIFSHSGGLVSLSPSEWSLVSEIFLKLHGEYLTNREGSDIMCKGYITQIMTLFLRSSLIKERNQGRPIKSWKNVEAAIHQIHLNYSNPDLSVHHVSQAAGLSTNYLSVVFKKEIGQSIHHYINHIRLEKAKELMVHPDKNFSEIAYMVGFSSLYVFSKVFKKHTGINPSKFISSLSK
jgi:AraC-like DNA-binding protein